MSALLPLLLATGVASADGESIDVELQRPSFGAATLAGVDHPLGEHRRLVVGVLGLYLRDPLVLLVDDRETGAVVAQRYTTMLGAAYDVSPRVELRGVLPVSLQWGSEESYLAADGMGMADPSIGLRVTTLQRGPWSTAVRADALLPLGSRQRYMGEGRPRSALGLLAALDGDRLGLHADLGAVLRSAVETDSDLVLGHEATLGFALRYATWPGRQDLYLGTLTRWPLLQAGGAPLSSEILMGSRLSPSARMDVDLGVGRGLTPGYGTTEFRGWVGLRWAFTGVGEPEPEPDLDLVWTEPSAPAPELAPRVENIRWQDGQLAQVRKARIEIREPIQFEVDTAHILSESQPILLAVADILESTPQILHVVIEGHASAEGAHAYNYQLSIERARSILRALVEVGVHPRRLSCRGMGEVAPVVLGDDEASLAANRRVLFLIAEQLDPLDPLPPEEQHIVPWNQAAPAAGEVE